MDTGDYLQKISDAIWTVRNDKSGSRDPGSQYIQNDTLVLSVQKRRDVAWRFRNTILRHDDFVT